VVRYEGRLYIRYRTASSKLQPRTITLPDWYVTVLRERRKLSNTTLVYPSMQGMLRDPANTGHHIKAALVDAGFPWATAHTFRRTLATLIEKHHGMDAAQAALGHRSAKTTQLYVKKARLTCSGAEVMNRLVLLPPADLAIS
jgi:integrase